MQNFSHFSCAQIEYGFCFFLLWVIKLIKLFALKRFSSFFILFQIQILILVFSIIKDDTFMGLFLLKFWHYAVWKPQTYTVPFANGLNNDCMDFVFFWLFSLLIYFMKFLFASTHLYIYIADNSSSYV